MEDWQLRDLEAEYRVLLETLKQDLGDYGY